jgi:hypothetical protein
MSITRLGATKQYAENWEEIFGRRKKTAAKMTARTKSAKKKVAKKSKSSAKKSRFARRKK